MNVQTANRADLEIEILFNDELYNYLENKEGNVEDFVLNSSDEELRDVLTEYIIANNETE